jgi:predicted nucleic acid-binding protein
MDWLADTSIITRTIHSGNPLQQTAIDTLALLRKRGETLCTLPQNLIEFWAVATRPIASNGLGLTIEDAENEIAKIKFHFILKSEDETIFENWENLVKTYRVSGKTTHDARIVAAMQTHKIENLLTFNVADFKRYSNVINVFAPQDII